MASRTRRFTTSLMAMLGCRLACTPSIISVFFDLAHQSVMRVLPSHFDLMMKASLSRQGPTSAFHPE